MMDSEIEKRLKQMAIDTISGIFGQEAQTDFAKMQSYNNKDAYYLEVINSLYFPKNPADKDLHNIGKSTCENLIILYRDVKTKNPKIARNFFNAFIKDYPGTNNTKLFNQFITLIETSSAYKNAINSSDYLMVWELIKKQLLSANEFLNILIGYINFIINFIMNNKENKNLLSGSYKSKIDSFNKNYLNAVFPVISNIANPDLRNAIAHSKIWNDRENEIITYETKNNIIKVDTITFVGIAGATTYLCPAYVSFLCVIYILEYTNYSSCTLLPDEVKNILKKQINEKLQLTELTN